MGSEPDQSQQRSFAQRREKFYQSLHKYVHTIQLPRKAYLLV